MNISLFYFLHSFAFVYPWFDHLVQFFAVPFIYIVIIVITIILILKAQILKDGFRFLSIWSRGKDIAIIILSTGFSYVLSNILKLILRTDRPFVLLSNINTLIHESGYAFPSGHSATIAAFAFAVFFKNKKLGYFCFGAAILIGLSRVIVGVHFPLDIIGGYATGFLVAYFFKTL